MHVNYFWRGRESIEKIEFVTEKKTWQSLQKRDLIETRRLAGK